MNLIQAIQSLTSIVLRIDKIAHESGLIFEEKEDSFDEGVYSIGHYVYSSDLVLEWRFDIGDIREDRSMDDSLDLNTGGVLCLYKNAVGSTDVVKFLIFFAIDVNSEKLVPQTDIPLTGIVDVLGEHGRPLHILNEELHARGEMDIDTVHLLFNLIKQLFSVPPVNVRSSQAALN